MWFYLCKVIDETPFLQGFRADDRKGLLKSIKNWPYKLVSSKDIQFPESLETMVEAQVLTKKLWLHFTWDVDFFEIKFFSLTLAHYKYIARGKDTLNKRLGYYVCSNNVITWFKMTNEQMKKISSPK